MKEIVIIIAVYLKNIKKTEIKKLILSLAVNHRVGGSSPSGGANLKPVMKPIRAASLGWLFYFLSFYFFVTNELPCF